MDPITLMALSGGVNALTGIAGSRSSRRAAEIQAQAAREAAQAQLTASRESTDLTRQMYERNLGLQAPQYRTGQLALSALSSGLGLGSVQRQPMTPTPQGGGAPTYTNAMGQTVDAQGNVVRAMPQLGGGDMGATQEELDAAGQGMAGRFTETFKPSDLTTDPSYQFRLNEGMRAIQARGAATGMLQTGQGLRDISDYGQQSASQEYGSAYDRFMRNQEALYSRLSGLAGMGSEAGARSGEYGTRAAESIGATTVAGARAGSEYLTSGAAAQAAGRVGSTQALAGAGQSGMQDWMTLQYLNRMPTGGSTVGQPQPTGMPLSRTIG